MVINFKPHCIDMKKLQFIVFTTIMIVAGILLLATCGKITEPTNLEPSILNLKATEITRNSAKLSVEIENHGSGSFAEVRFFYKAADAEWIQTEEIENPSGTVETMVNGLTAGKEYIFFAEGIRNTAVLKSEESRFTTAPNEKPSISELKIVSSGPTSVIARFSLLSDGGEALTEAGCHVRKCSDDTMSTFKVENISASDTAFTILVNSLKVMNDYEITPYAVNTVGETEGESVKFKTSNSINLTQAGDLRIIITDAAFPDKSISISGVMNGDDFACLRKMPFANIDISSVDIMEGGGTYDGNRYTETDVVSTGLFSDLPELESLALPFSTRAIERNAFSRSNRLRTLEIPANVASLIPSSECESLEHLTVSPANTNFKSMDGAICSQDTTEIIWFPQAKSGEYSLPATITIIRENSFTDSHLETLTLSSRLEDIERGAFTGSHIRELVIPDNIRNIREGLLQNCPNLKTVKFGTNTESIGNYVFDNTPLEHLYIMADFPPFVSKNAFANNKELFDKCTLHVPKGCRTIYRNHSILGLFNNITESE